MLKPDPSSSTRQCESAPAQPPRPACLLVSYPLQSRQQEGVESLAVWVVVSAGLGLVGVALFRVEVWLG
jgi:hypothetical protein